MNIYSPVLPGNYFGSFAIVSGVDSNTQDVLAIQHFEVSVASASVPEPGNVSLLLGFGHCGCVVKIHYQNRRCG